jgi:hypothetical protein
VQPFFEIFKPHPLRNGQVVLLADPIEHRR